MRLSGAVMSVADPYCRYEHVLTETRVDSWLLLLWGVPTGTTVMNEWMPLVFGLNRVGVLRKMPDDYTYTLRTIRKGKQETIGCQSTPSCGIARMNHDVLRMQGTPQAHTYHTTRKRPS